MSESETTGRCRSEMEKACGTSSSIARVDLVLADAIDRLAADVAAVKAKADAISPEDVAHLVECEKAWVRLVEEKETAAIRERDEARAEVVRLMAELAARPADGNSPKTSESSPAAAQPAAASDAQPSVWGVRRVGGGWVSVCQSYRQAASSGKEWDTAEGWAHDIIPLYAAPQPAAPPAGWLTDRERHVLSSLLSERDWSLHWADDIQPVFRSILARAGSPPVVEVPAIGLADSMTMREAQLSRAYRAAMDAVGVKWKEVGRE